MAGVPREALDLAARAKEDTGAFIVFEPARNGHLRVINQRTGQPIRHEGKPLQIPNSASDWRQWRNEAAKWRQAGLISRPTRHEERDTQLAAQTEEQAIRAEMDRLAPSVRCYMKLRTRLDQLTTTELIAA